MGGIPMDLLYFKKIERFLKTPQLVKTLFLNNPFILPSYFILIIVIEKTCIDQ